MKHFVVCCFCCLLFACDPYGRITYSIKNKTTDTVYVMFKNHQDSLIVVLPDSMQVLETRRFVGYAKEKYKSNEYQNWFAENSVLIKKRINSSIYKPADTRWKYSGGRISGQGILYVNK